MTTIGAWNVKGMNSDGKQSEIKYWVKNYRIGIFGLLETRVKQQNADKISKVFGSSFLKVDNYAHHGNDRIWIL